MTTPIDADAPELQFDFELTPGEWDVLSSKGVCWFAKAVFPDGRRYALYFVDPWRAIDDVGGRSDKFGVIVEPGLIVVSQITIENMRAALACAWNSGVFAHWRPIEA